MTLPIGESTFKLLQNTMTSILSFLKNGTRLLLPNCELLRYEATLIPFGKDEK